MDDLHAGARLSESGSAHTDPMSSDAHRAVSVGFWGTLALCLIGYLIVSLVQGTFALHDPAGPPLPVRSCAVEDDPGPCHWDARHQGNGKGLSFTIENGQVRYDQP